MHSPEELFQMGKAKNLETDQSYQPAVARSLFEQAARENHKAATCALALMLHQGTGGPKDCKRAMKLWEVGYFNLGDREALECLINAVEEEIAAGEKQKNCVDLQSLLRQLLSLQNVSASVHKSLHLLISGS